MMGSVRGGTGWDRAVRWGEVSKGHKTSLLLSTSWMGVAIMVPPMTDRGRI